MKRYNYLLLFALASCCTSMKAQVTDFPGLKRGTTSTPAKKTAPNDAAVENNVRNCLIIIQQNYQLEDITQEKKGPLGIGKTKSLFGRGGNKFFGTICTIGVKTEKGYYTDGRAVLPWLYDPNYGEYRNRNQYLPVISETNYHAWNEQKYKKFVFNNDPGKLGKDSILLISTKLSDPKLLIDPKTGDLKGWIVWVVKDSKATEPDAFAFSTQATELKFDSSGTAELKGSAPQQVIYGLFVTQQENKRGQSINVLSGFALKSNGKWLVRKPAMASANGTKTINSANPDELTPVKK